MGGSAAKDSELATLTVLRHMMGMKALLGRMANDTRLPKAYRRACALKMERANELADWLYAGGSGDAPSPWM